MQERLDLWNVVQEQIRISGVKRFPYKALLGVSLTKHILKFRGLGWCVRSVYYDILVHPNVLVFLNDNPGLKDEFKKKLWISVCARFSEENQRGR